MAIVTYNDNGTIKVVKFGNYVVSTDADPIVQKQWVFLHGADTWHGASIQHELTGILAPDEPGCNSSTAFHQELTSLFNPTDCAIGTRAAIRMKSPSGDTACATWAIFEVQAV